jgi:hypothetical protein
MTYTHKLAKLIENIEKAKSEFEKTSEIDKNDVKIVVYINEDKITL